MRYNPVRSRCSFADVARHFTQLWSRDVERNARGPKCVLLDAFAQVAYSSIMLVAAILAVVALSIALGAFASSAWRKRREASNVLGRQLDTRAEEDAAADAAHGEAQADASVVLRSSDPELRDEVERLAARGRTGK